MEKEQVSYGRIVVIQIALLCFGLGSVLMGGTAARIGSAVCFFSAGIGTVNLLQCGDWEEKK